jgi:hypothetical protein
LIAESFSHEEAIMSADILGVANVMRTAEREQEPPRVQPLRPSAGWNPGKFAREQLSGLVRQVFSASGTRLVRQIVFSAVDPEADVRNICRQVGESLALETAGGIAVVGEYPQLSLDWRTFQAANQDRNITLRETAARMCGNLWLVPACESARSTESVHKYLWRIRREFEYSIVAAPPAGSTGAAAIGMFADGMILVLSARYTRRATALRIKESLQKSQVRLLGTVLSDREFPIPERIYRRL